MFFSLISSQAIIGICLVNWLNFYLFLFSRETNLKVRQALVETAEMGDDVKLMGKFDGKLRSTKRIY